MMSAPHNQQDPIRYRNEEEDTGGGPPTGPASGDLQGEYPAPSLITIGTPTVSDASGTRVPIITIDETGRVTSITSTPIIATPSGIAGGMLNGFYPDPNVTNLAYTPTSLSLGPSAGAQAGGTAIGADAFAATDATAMGTNAKALSARSVVLGKDATDSPGAGGWPGGLNLRVADESFQAGTSDYDHTHFLAFSVNGLRLWLALTPLEA